MRTSISFLCLVCLAVCQSQAQLNSCSGRSLAMGGITSILTRDAWAAMHNPALLPFNESLTVGLSHMPGFFGMKELRQSACILSFPFREWSVGLGGEVYGASLYRETSLSMSFGKKIIESFSAGFSLHWFHIGMNSYGAASRLLLHLGGATQLSENTMMGFSVKNLFGATVGRLNERLPQVYTLGASYTPEPTVLIAAEIEKELRTPFAVKAGIEKIILNTLILRGGLQSSPDMYSFGCAVFHENIEFGYGGNQHGDLGWTHRIELIVRW